MRCLCVALMLLVASVASASDNVLVLKATETYPKSGEQVNSQVYVNERFVRIDGNNTTSIFDAEARLLSVYDHATQTYRQVTKQNLATLKQSVKESLSNDESPLQSKHYRFHHGETKTLIDGVATTRGRLSYEQQLIADIDMVRFDEVGMKKDGPASVRAWHKFFAGYLHDFPSRDLALHSHSMAGLMESAGINMHNYAFLRVVFYDELGRIEKLVESRPVTDHHYDHSVFKPFDHYRQIQQ